MLLLLAGIGKQTIYMNLIERVLKLYGQVDDNRWQHLDTVIKKFYEIVSLIFERSSLFYNRTHFYTDASYI